MDIDYIPTSELVEALLRRKGVTAIKIRTYEPYKIEGKGPAVILIVED